MAIKTRKGSSGEDVTATEQFVEDVVATDEDQSYEVEGTDSPEEIVQESTVITDDHEVVNPIEDGEIVDEEIEETREGRRGRRTRRGVRRGSRKGDGEEEDVEEVIMNEDGDTQEVELPEPDEEELEEIEESEEREGRRGRRTRRGVRRGSRRGATLVDGKSPMDYLKMLEELQGFPEQRDIIQSGDEDAAEEYLKKDADINGQSYEEAVRSIAEEFEDDSYLGGRKGSRKGSRKGIAYGGKSEVHQESIKAAVAVAMRDRRL